MTTLTVGPKADYPTISAATLAAGNGDTINVAAGTYANDFVKTNKSLDFQAVGGPVRVVATKTVPGDKGIFTVGAPGANVTINGFEISGATGPSRNDAGVRYEGGTLTLSNDYIHNNQDGLLANSDPNGAITINNSEFASNGTGSGQTHNIYVNQVHQLTVTGSTIENANNGHEIKSRAYNTTVTNNSIIDPNGRDVYSIDLPNGGNATITGNTIEQSAPGNNPTMIAYGEEGASNPGTSVTVSGNSFVNYISNGSAVMNRSSAPIRFTDNTVYGLLASRLPTNDPGTTFLGVAPTLDTASAWASGITGGLLPPAGTASAGSVARNTRHSVRGGGHAGAWSMFTHPASHGAVVSSTQGS